jgi:unsaturated chondroitin disaccharide hydrolase
MIRKSILILTLVAGLLSLSKVNAENISWVDSALTGACRQSLLLASEISHLGDGVYPRSVDRNGKLVTSDAGWWCSGFFPGVLLQLYGQIKNDTLLHYAKPLLKGLESQQYNTHTHDLGFMLYCSFGEAERLAPDTTYEHILLNGAQSLSHRFNKTVGCIQSWDPWNWWQFPVIIDNMMNLEMLMWASNFSGNKVYRDIAISHADKTLKNHFRSDNSSYHVVSYRKSDGSVEFKGTNQGASDSSAWARGQMWGLYGYTMMYRFTHKRKYLKQAHAIAKYILENPMMPADGIPYWDFSRHDFRDSSSAAVMASALLELSKYSDAKLSRIYRNYAVKQLHELYKNYTASYGSMHGFILLHGVGNYPGASEIDAPLTYGDYYYIEALCRLKQIYNR